MIAGRTFRIVDRRKAAIRRLVAGFNRIVDIHDVFGSTIEVSGRDTKLTEARTNVIWHDECRTLILTYDVYQGNVCIGIVTKFLRLNKYLDEI